MKDFIFKSVLSPYIQGLLAEKRAMGYKYDVGEYILRNFDLYWVETIGDFPRITPETLASWSKQSQTEGKPSQDQRICVVRQLSIFMNGIGIASYIPTTRMRRARPVAHVLTTDEIHEFFRVVDNYVPSRSCRDTTRISSEYGVIFRLIMTTGLRRTEAATIRIQDINWDTNSIAVYNAKGRKDRLVYMAEDMSNLCREYLGNLRCLIGFDTCWLFPGMDPSRHISSGTLMCLFRRFWSGTSFAASCEKKPTIHSLRHSFVVIRMNTWMELGLDLNVMMQYLSKHLGHKSSNETFYYYHQVSEAFRIIRQKDTLASAVIPEVRVK